MFVRLNNREDTKRFVVYTPLCMAGGQQSANNWNLPAKTVAA